MQAIPENEAKKLWCPFVRTGVCAGAGAVSVNRHVTDVCEDVTTRDIYNQTRCLGSGCMAWRYSQPALIKPMLKTETNLYFADLKNPNKFPEIHEFPLPDVALGGGWKAVFAPQKMESCWKLQWVRRIDPRFLQRLGYCGLAGAPDA